MNSKPNNFISEYDSFILKLAHEINHPEDIEKADRMLKAIFHAIRGQISISESFQLIAPLPLFLKRIYVDGWAISSKRNGIKNMFDFMKELRILDKKSGLKDFPTLKQTENNVLALSHLLNEYYCNEELKNFMTVLPPKFRSNLFSRAQ